jgi:hypothetical protein
VAGEKSYCSFFGKDQDNVVLLIAGQGKFICDARVKGALADLAEHR